MAYEGITKGHCRPKITLKEAVSKDLQILGINKDIDNDRAKKNIHIGDCLLVDIGFRLARELLILSLLLLFVCIELIFHFYFYLV